jgi:uncharacterized protein (TIGR00255 family)
MTGFGRSQGQAAWGAWAWEARSVNGRSIDVRASAPPGFDAVDFEAKKRVRERFQRGSFQIQLRIDFTRDPSAAIVDMRELNRLARLSRNWASAKIAPASFDGLVAAAGGKASRTALTIDEAMTKLLIAGLDQALDTLDEARRKEGEALAALFVTILGQIEAQVKLAIKLAALQPEQVKEKFRQRLAEIAKDAAMDPDRVAQEIILIAGRADVREELDRLTAHVAGARGILDAGDAAGRKLDFLCQELNREANTLCSKSASLELTNAGLALKSLIEQFREQVQNVE